jgi:hypothetical protein
LANVAQRGARLDAFEAGPLRGWLGNLVRRYGSGI